MASATHDAAPRPHYVERFTLTERLIHWVHASAFLVLLGSGLVLYLPSLSAAIARRPLIKDIHFWTGISWAGAILLIAVLGNRRALAQTAPRDRPVRSGRPPLPRRRHPPPTRPFQRRPEGQRNPDCSIRDAVLRLGPAALVRRARHAPPTRRHRLPPRHAHVHLGRDRRRPPLPVPHPPDHAARSPRHDPRNRPRRLGSKTSLEMDDPTPEWTEPVSRHTLSHVAYRGRHFLALLSALCLFVVG